jgi:MFS transporter, DHA1 family, multidrug resistance protein
MKFALTLPNSASSRRVVYVASASGFLSMAATDIYVPSLPSIGSDLRVSIYVLQSSLSLNLVGYAAGQIMAGLLLYKAESRIVAYIGSMIILIGALACMLSYDATTLIAGRATLGVGSGILGAFALISLKKSLSASELPSGMSAYSVIIYAAPAISPVLGYLCATVYSWRLSFAVVGLAAILVACSQPSGGNVQLDAGVTTDSRGHGEIRLVRAMKVVSVFGYCLAMMMVMAMVFSFIGIGPFMYAEQFHLSSAQFTLTASLLVLPVIAGATISNKLVDSVDPRAIFLIASLGLALSVFAIYPLKTIIQSPLVMVIYIALIVNLFEGIIFGVAPTLAMNASSTSPNVTGPLIGVASLIGCALGPWLATPTPPTNHSDSYIYSLSVCAAWLVVGLLTSLLPRFTRLNSSNLS